jgi:hypothetical protein
MQFRKTWLRGHNQYGGLWLIRFFLFSKSLHEKKKYLFLELIEN